MALVATPWRVVPVSAALPETVEIRVVAGDEYELRTDAEDVDEDTGAVTYPLVFVSDGADDLPEVGMTPFHKLQPATIIPTTHMIVVGSNATCNVWVLQKAVRQQRATMPGGCGCGCKQKKKLDDEDETSEA